MDNREREERLYIERWLSRLNSISREASDY